MPRFVFVVWGLVPGGTYAVLRHVWARLEGRTPVSVVSHGPDRLPGPGRVRIAGGPLSHPLVFPWIWVYVVRMLVGCLLELRRGPRNAVLLPQDSLATGAAAALAARMAGGRAVVMEHGSAVVIHREFFWRERVGRRRLHRFRLPLLRASVWVLHRLCLRLADGALIPGDEAIPLYRAAGVARDRILRYHIPVDLDRFRPRPADQRSQLRERFGLPPDRSIVLIAGRLAPEKGIEVILRAIAQLPHELAPTVAVAGDGPLRDGLAALARSLGIDARFLGNLDEPDVADLMAGSDLFAYGGLEGTNTPVSVLEAMASGLTVVGTDEPIAMRELLAEDRGTVVTPGSVSEMRDALERYLRSPRLRERAGAGARTYVERHHSPAVFDAELERFLSWFSRDAV